VACDSRVLLCHRSPGRRWYPDVWDLPGGHVEAGESPARAPVREVHEELGVSMAEPSGPELARFVTAAFDMRVWLVRACLDLHQPEPKIYGTGCRHRAARSTELARARCCTSLLYGACGRLVVDTRMPSDLGALGGTRTPNLLIRSQMLYPLSYERQS
jgi:ADP-ribose pyrophosphatase YjhB (NUDIX family)